MGIKNIFQGMSSWSQLFFLCIFSLFGFVIASLFAGVFALFFLKSGVDPRSLTESTDYLRLVQFFAVILWFFIPAYLCAYLYNEKPGSFLKTNKPVNFMFLAIAIALILVIQPIISFTAYYNEQIRLPDFMSGFETWIRTTEQTNKLMIERLMGGKSIGSLMISLLIVAVMAAIAEEFFFRGIMQQLFNKITNNYHWAIWITAFIFSAIHMQFLGFIPRILLGALLGYLFVWSGSLWIPIIVHFANNALGVVLHWLYYGTPEYEQIENMGVNDFWWATLLSAILISIIVVYLSKEYTRNVKYSEY